MPIVKVQVAIVPRDAPALIYDEARAHQVMQRLDAETLDAMDDDLKAYFEAAWDARDRRWVFIQRVEDQPW